VATGGVFWVAIRDKVYTTGKPDKSFHWPVIRKDSTKRTVATSVSLRRDTDGEPVGFRGIVRDITESKQAEEALRKSESCEEGGRPSLSN